MNKELCFYIENKGLYLEQVLVDYNDIPIFFLCKNEEQFYIALCTDMEELSYVVEKLSPVDVYKLLHGKITMRDAFLSHEEYWEIISGEEISSDKVIKRTVDCIEHSVLPEENACFQILTEEIESYVKKFDNVFFSNKFIEVSDKKLDFSEQIIDELFDEVCVSIEKFTSLGGFSFNANEEQHSTIVFGSDEIYKQPARKKVILTRYDNVEKWHIDAAINIAA